MTREIRSTLRVAWGLLAVCVLAGAARGAEIGARVERFTLPDAYARDRSLDEFKDKSLVVVAFLGAECPLARLYGPRLQELSELYAERGVAFVGIDANAQDSLSDIMNYTRQYGIKFPLLKDRDGAVADQFGAVRNPEVFVLDKDRAIRYRGRVDDQYGLGASSGYARPELKQRNLGQALDELLAGKAVSETVTQVTGCIIGRTAKVAPKGDVTYSKHVAAVIDNHCAECHRAGQVGPFALTDYNEVVGWAAMIKEVISDGRMPPWSANPEFGHFGNDPRLSAEEKSLLFAWIENGCPQGDIKDLPKPRQWAEGWRISKPDQVVSMTKAFSIPAEGVINYQNFTVDPGWTEDKWIQEAEVQPGAWGNVHHIIISISPPRAAGRPATESEELAAGEPEAAQPRQRGGRNAQRSTEGFDVAALTGGRLSAFIPGRNPTVCKPGTAVFAPAGSRLTFQMHYTTNGKATEDISRVGVVFADPKTVKYASYTSGARAGDFAIPPFDPNHKVESDVTFAKELHLIVLHPHMHLRGKDMRYEAIYPDGSREVLLDVPRYDFNWQFEYELAEPKFLPAGTRMHVTAHFDNSENNVANPDASKTIVWGPQTWDEMMIGFYTVVVPLDRALAAKAQATQSPASPTPERPAAPAGAGQ